MCCKGGNVSFPIVNTPLELLQLFLDASAEGSHFKQNIRSYNHVISFTSIGVNVDESILATGCGIYTFRAQGSFYHNIGGFYLNEGIPDHVSCNYIFMILNMSYKIGCWKILNYIRL
jgi:hypothetical protein